MDQTDGRAFCNFSSANYSFGSIPLRNHRLPLCFGVVLVQGLVKSG